MAALTALALTPVASAAARVYDGSFVGNDASSVTLTVKKRDGQRMVTGFEARSFPISCDQGIQAILGSAEISGATKVTRKGRFAVKAENGAQTVQLSGRFVSSTGAAGTFRYSGLTKVADGTDTTRLDCDSGLLSWRAVH